MYDFIIGIGENLIRHGWSVSFLGALFFLLLKQRPSKRWMKKHFPILKRWDEADVMNYEARQIRIESKLDALMSAGGVSWDADLRTGNAEKKLTDGQQKRSSSLLAVFAPVTIARYFTPLRGISLSQQRRMNMKSKFLSRKFLLALATGILVILNDGLDMGLDSETIMYVVGIVGVWIFGESAVDLSKKKTEVSNASYTTPEDAGDVQYPASR